MKHECSRDLECGDLSPLFNYRYSSFGLAPLKEKFASHLRRRKVTDHKAGDKSPHSKI